jgi:hypothetical protein
MGYFAGAPPVLAAPDPDDAGRARILVSGFSGGPIHFSGLPDVLNPDWLDGVLHF